MINSVRPELGSFRDPRGRIFYIGDRVFRSIAATAIEDFEFVLGTGLLDRLSASGKAITTAPVAPEIGQKFGADAVYVVEHSRLPFISYPYEWPFAALKAAALLHLDVQLEALEADISLSDASAYNVQFVGACPVFIDILSFRKYREGEIWAGHHQFCEQFLAPLLLQSRLGVSYNHWYRGSPEGISIADLRRLLPWTAKLSLNVLVHIVLQSSLQSSALSKNENKSSLAAAKLPRSSYRHMLEKMRAWIATLEPAGTKRTVWREYADNHTYSDDEVSAKKEFIARFAASVKPAIVWDMGCNTGDYSDVALKNGAELCIGFDADHGALDLAYSRARSESLNFLPLYLDGANPTPNQGWNESERKSLAARADADGLIALAFVHHIAIGRNVPLANVVNWLMALAPQGVIEFVPKRDPMVRNLLALREDIFPDYNEDAFLAAVSARAEIVETRSVTRSGRLLVRYRKA